MNPMFRNLLAVVAGILVGVGVNMGIITISGAVIPPPEGADVTTTEGLKASMHLFQPRHFIMPFLAHALGTLAGAFVAAAVAASHRMKLAMAIGVFFLAGGIASVQMLPSPLWFNIVDIAGAYLPTAWLAGRVVENRAAGQTAA